MRSVLGTLIPLLALSGAILLAQEEFEFEGNTKDIRKLPVQTRQNHDYTFVRLMYNGRIPGYLKNWYTDYPTGDRNLVDIGNRPTSLRGPHRPGVADLGAEGDSELDARRVQRVKASVGRRRLPEPGDDAQPLEIRETYHAT